jgi:aarF domain-containing kinase
LSLVLLMFALISAQLIVEELVAVIDAMSREALSEALRLVMGSATAVTALRSVEALGPLRAMLMPLPLPLEMLHSMEPAVALTKEDRQALNTLRAILDLMQPSVPSLMASIPGMATAGRTTLRAAGEMMPMLPELIPGVQVTVELFIRQLVRRMALRLAEDLEPGKFGAAAPPAAATKPVSSPAQSQDAARMKPGAPGSNWGRRPAV